MKINDARTPEQKKTHHWAVVARDSFMSGWGQARNGHSRCAWALPPELADHEHIGFLRKWVIDRKEMKHVNVVDLKEYRCPKGTAHFSIYVVSKEHRAFV